LSGAITLNASGQASYTPTATQLAVAGNTHSIKAVYSGASSYAPSTSSVSSLTINPKIVTLTGSMTYSGSTTINATNLSVNNPVGSDQVTVASGSATLASANAGARAINSSSLTGLSLGGAQQANYTLTGASGSVTVNQAPLTVTATGPALTYGTALSAGTSTANFSCSGTVNGETVTSVTLTPSPAILATTPAGTAYTVTPSLPTGANGFLAANYSLTPYEYNGTVAQATLIVAANGTLVYGSDPSNAVYTPTYYPLLNGDSPGVFTGSADFTNNATATNYVGTNYTVTVVNAGNLTATNYTFVPAGTNGVLTITPAPVTITGIVADNKTYDGTNTATLDFSGASLVGLSNGDDVTLDSSAETAVFPGRNVGTNLTVTVSGLALDQNLGTNYTLTAQPTGLTADISTFAINVTAAADTKNYDGGTTSVGVPTPAPALAPGDTASFTQAFATRNVGAGLTLTPAGLVNDGNGGANYSYTYDAVTTGEIDQTNLTVKAATDSKTYDGTANSSATPVGITAGSLQTGDTAPAWTQSFDSRNAGSRTLIPAGVVNDGNGGANYNVTYATASGSISKLGITVTAVTDTKLYDGGVTSSQTPTFSPALATGDTTTTFAQTFNTANVGTGLTLTPAGVVNDGNGGANYSYTYDSVTTGEIDAIGSTTALSSTPSVWTNGVSIQFTAAVSSSVGTPSGNVVFYTNGVSVATVVLSGIGNTASTSMILPVSASPITVGASYAAQANWQASTNCLSQVVYSAVTYSTTNTVQSIVNNGDGTFTLNMQGTPGASYYLVSSGDVSAPLATWTPVVGSTNVAAAVTGQWSAVVSNAAPAFYDSVAVNPAP
jgi:hypothetical protein